MRRGQWSKGRASQARMVISVLRASSPVVFPPAPLPCRRLLGGVERTWFLESHPASDPDSSVGCHWDLSKPTSEGNACFLVVRDRVWEWVLNADI